MPSPILVTGAAGFIGSHLSAALLARGDRVVGVDNLDPFYDPGLKRANLQQLDGPGFEFVEADICDADALPALFRRCRPAQVVHLAALAGVRPSIEDPARYVRVNVDGTVNVLEAARAAGCGRIAFASSSSVYGNNRKIPFAETDPVDEPISPYAATKRAGELLCQTYARLFGLAVVALRFFTVYGPAQRPDLAICSFMRLVAADREIPMFGDGQTSRDYTYIDDVVDGALSAMRMLEDADPALYRLYNLGGSKPVALAEMIERIGEVVGRRPRIHQLPMQPGDVDRTYADLTRSQEELGYRPTMPFLEGLRRQWEWMRSRETRPASEPGSLQR
jgi:UDP-glucuronate 4-epimerase